MTFLMVAGAALCGWTLLNVFSGERLRRVQELETKRAAEAQAEGRSS